MIHISRQNNNDLINMRKEGDMINLCMVLLPSLLVTLLSTMRYFHPDRCRLPWLKILSSMTLALSLTMPIWLSPEMTTLQIPLFETQTIFLPLSLEYNTLVWLMLCSSSFISLMTHEYSMRYLHSDQNQMRFIANLSLLTFSIMILIMSANLLTLWIAWSLVGVSLYNLLRHYEHSTIAQRSANQFLQSHVIGNACIGLAVIFAVSTAGTTEYLDVFFYSHFVTKIVLCLIFIAIMIQSVQFPFHGWLIDTMHAPTPISAVMHAGVVNVGGVLLAKLCQWYSVETDIQAIIMISGVLTAIVGQTLMLIQADVKKRLAYSTVAQMGYMILQCGLGCYISAVFHLVAHGLYKANLFLSAGQTLNQHNIIVPKSKQTVSDFIFSVLCTLMLVATGFWFLSWSHVQLTVITWMLVAVTVQQLFSSGFMSSKTKTQVMQQWLLITLMYFCYLYSMSFFINHLLDFIIEAPGALALPLVVLMPCVLLILVTKFIIESYCSSIGGFVIQKILLINHLSPVKFNWMTKLGVQS